ncbi:MAG: Hpt domain-containing protein [Pseudomonadota bacterium]
MSIRFDLGELTAQGFTPHEGRIDLDALSEIVEELGADLIEEVAESLYAEAEGALAALGTAISAQNAEECESLMHFLKGCVSNLGMTEFSELCRAGELAAKDGTVPDGPGYAALKAAYARSKANMLILQAIIAR